MKNKLRHGRRQWLIAAVALVVAIGLVASCQRGPKGRTLTLAINSGVEGDALRQAAQDYEKQTGVHIEIAEFPYANLFEKELIDLNSHTGAYDLIMLDDPWFPKFASLNVLTDFGPLLQKRGKTDPDNDFVASSLALCRHPYQTGPLYALPYVGNSQLFFYRRDLFQKHNLKVPATWEDVLTAAKTISEQETTGAPGGGKVYGYVMRAAQGNAAVADFMPIFWAFAGEMFDSSGQPTVNGPEGIAALKLMLELGKYSPPGYASFNADEVGAHLLQGTAAMSINWPAWISSFSDPLKSKVIGQMEFGQMPGSKNPGHAEIGNWLIAIPRESRNTEAAMDFLLWATTAEQMRLSAQRGNPPTRRSVFTDPQLQAKFPSYPAQLRSLESSRPRPRTPLWNEVENAFGIYLSKANSGELSAEDAMNQANAEIKKDHRAIRSVPSALADGIKKLFKEPGKYFIPSADADGTDSMTLTLQSKRAMTRYVSDRALAYFLLAPTIAVLLSLTIYPLIYSIRIGLQSETGNWTLQNFTRLFTDQFFLSALAHTLVYAIVALTIEFLLGLGLAVLLNEQMRARSMFRALLLLPMMLPPIVVGVIWRLMLNSNFGAVNGTLKSLGLNTEALTWTASPKLAMASVILADVWQWTPFMFLILLAGLQAIPQEPYEAALIDGSSAWQTFRHVTLPLLKPAILIALLLRTMDLLRVFDQIFILTEGGPGFATETVSLYIYRTAFRFSNFGYAAAMSFVLLLITNVISVGYIRLLQTREA